MRIKKQGGFTLVELVVVIAILGILAAFAIPKFISLEDQARKSVSIAVRGAVVSASALAHSLAVAESKSAATNETLDMEGAGNVALAYGYASSVGIIAATTLNGDWAGTNSGSTATFTDGTCTFTYASATAANAPPAISTITGTGCT